MDIPSLWSTLDAESRDWLVEHNGEAVTPAVLDALARANGGAAEPEWFAGDDEGDGPVLIDDVIDWIEAVANGEDPSGS